MSMRQVAIYLAVAFAAIVLSRKVAAVSGLFDKVGL
jgi:hypothetical protein